MVVGVTGICVVAGICVVGVAGLCVVGVAAAGLCVAEVLERGVHMVYMMS